MRKQQQERQEEPPERPPPGPSAPWAPPVSVSRNLGADFALRAPTPNGPLQVDSFLVPKHVSRIPGSGDALEELQNDVFQKASKSATSPKNPSPKPLAGPARKTRPTRTRKKKADDQKQQRWRW